MSCIISYQYYQSQPFELTSNSLSCQILQFSDAFLSQDLRRTHAARASRTSKARVPSAVLQWRWDHSVEGPWLVTPAEALQLCCNNPPKRPLGKAKNKSLKKTYHEKMSFLHRSLRRPILVIHLKSCHFLHQFSFFSQVLQISFNTPTADCFTEDRARLCCGWMKKTWRQPRTPSDIFRH